MIKIMNVFCGEQLHFLGLVVFTAVVMKSIILWDMTPWSVEFQPTFRRNISPPTSRCLLAFLLNLFLRPWRWSQWSPDPSVVTKRTTRRHTPEYDSCILDRISRCCNSHPCFVFQVGRHGLLRFLSISVRTVPLNWPRPLPSTHDQVEASIVKDQVQLTHGAERHWRSILHPLRKNGVMFSAQYDHMEMLNQHGKYCTTSSDTLVLHTAQLWHWDTNPSQEVCKTKPQR
jgi:hypothetical protein